MFSVQIPHSLEDAPRFGTPRKLQRPATRFAFLVMVITPCVAHHMAFMVDEENNVGNVTSVHLSKIFRSEIRKWPDGKSVVLVLHKDSVGETETPERLIKMSAGGLKASIAAHKDSIRIADSDADVLKRVPSPRRSRVGGCPLRRQLH
jgi:hypothetical protein